MVLDHTLTVDYHGTPDALERNMELEISRNSSASVSLNGRCRPTKASGLSRPAVGILHQVESRISRAGSCCHKDGMCFPDTLVGTDSHTGMIAGLGMVGWGVGGIEAESAMLGQPVHFLTPDVVGVNMIGALKPGVTGTDLVLHVTEILRRAKVVGKFVEFFGAGVRNLTVPDRATIANMSPEYGATIGFFPVDAQTIRYLRQTARSEQQVAAVEAYYMPSNVSARRCRAKSNTRPLSISIWPRSARTSPVRSGRRICVPLSELRERFDDALKRPVSAGGYNVAPMQAPAATGNAPRQPQHGDVVIAAITSCTNTSNPGVMVAAGLVAKKAVERGLTTKPWVKTSFAPGSRVVSEYLDDGRAAAVISIQLGFNWPATVARHASALPGRSMPILEKTINDNDVVACAVLSGNRNFEARIHPRCARHSSRARRWWLRSPLAGRVDIDVATEPLGIGTSGEAGLSRATCGRRRKKWQQALCGSVRPECYREIYGDGHHDGAIRCGRTIPQASGGTVRVERMSTYIKEPPFLGRACYRDRACANIRARARSRILGNSITTDHISPIGSIKASSPAGLYLQSHGVEPAGFQQLRRARGMNHEVMVARRVCQPAVART